MRQFRHCRHQQPRGRGHIADRSARPSASGLERVPSARRGRGLPAERGRQRLLRRSLLRADRQLRAHWNPGAAMDLVMLLTAYAIAAGAPRGPAHGHHNAAATLIASDPIDQWEPLISEASQRFGIEAAWIRAVMRAESAGQITLNGHPITSRAGAMGLMQVMPETYAEMRRRLGLGDDPYDPRDNILAGTAFLRAMYDRFGYPGCFAAYNAGPEGFDAWLRRDTPLPAETLAYLRTIGSDIADSVLAMGEPTVSDGPRTASSRPQTELEFRSGKSLFFVIGSAAAVPSGDSNQAAENGNPPAARSSIFVAKRPESAPS